MVGGGVRPGVAYGETDEYSYNIVRDPVHIRDFNATILHLFGIDHDPPHLQGPGPGAEADRHRAGPRRQIRRRLIPLQTLRRVAALLLSLLGVAADLRAADSPSEQSCDLCVVEATPGGHRHGPCGPPREGLKVVLTNHTAHLGGILSSGLAVWDTEWEGRRSPLYDGVRQALFDYYRDRYGPNSAQYHEALPGKKAAIPTASSSPHVIEKLLTDLIAREPNIAVLTGYYPVAAAREGRGP